MTTIDDLAITSQWQTNELPVLDDPRVRPITGTEMQWMRDGVIIREGLAPTGLIDEYAHAWRKANADRPGGWPHATPYMDCRQLLELCSFEGIQEVMQALIGEPMGLHLCLTGWRSTQRNWHQDGYLNPDANRDHYVAVWIALDDVHPDSGPFEYVAGSHRMFPRIGHREILANLHPSEHGPNWPTHSERILTPIFEKAIRERQLPVVQYLPKKGDVLFWHSRLLHRGSAPVDAQMERGALIAHYSGVGHRPDFPPAEEYAGGWYFPIWDGPPTGQ